MNDVPVGRGDEQEPVTVDLLADLQAGVLDDADAARLRQRARTDPEIAHRLAELDGLRRRLAVLGIDSASAGDVPADVTARISAALRRLPPPRPRT